MMKTNRLALALAGVLCLSVPALTAVPAFAAEHDETQEQTALQGSNMTLGRAIATAEQRTDGKAYDAGVDVDHGKARIVVETNGPKGVQTVIIDAQNGQVLATNAGGETD